MTKSGASFSIVGAGRVGSSLGNALVDAGWRCDFVVGEKIDASGLRKIRRHLAGARVLTSPSSLLDKSNIIFVSVTDDQIERVADELAGTDGINWSGKVVFHASGIVEVDKLAKLRNAGACIGALHPLAPFSSRFEPHSSRGIYYDFFGDRTALIVARRITKTLSSKLLVLGSERERELLHVAGVIVSNFTVVGNIAAGMLVSGFVDKKDAKPMLHGLLASTVDNLSADGTSGSLTGPLARGDLAVVKKHLESLENHGLLLQFYRVASLLGIEALLKDEKSPERKSKLLEIRKLLEA